MDSKRKGDEKVVYEKTIQGKYVDLRSATEEDAERTLEMRQDKERTKFLHYVENNLEKQIEWIRQQRSKEGDYFFVVMDKTEKIIGTMGIYEINGQQGHMGRLLMFGNAIQSFEAYLLLFHFSFDQLGLAEIHGDTDITNRAAIHFSEMYGFHYEAPVYDAVLDREVSYATAYRNEFESYAKKIEKMIYRS